jgi:hypothetical protein
MIGNWRLKKSKNTKFNNCTNELIWRTPSKGIWGVGLTESVSNRDPPPPTENLNSEYVNLLLGTWVGTWRNHMELATEKHNKQPLGTWWELDGTIWNTLRTPNSTPPKKKKKSQFPPPTKDLGVLLPHLIGWVGLANFGIC